MILVNGAQRLTSARTDLLQIAHASSCCFTPGQVRDLVPSHGDHTAQSPTCFLKPFRTNVESIKGYVARARQRLSASWNGFARPMTRPDRQYYVLNGATERVHADGELVRAKAANDIEQLCPTRDQARSLVKCSVRYTRTSTWCVQRRITCRVCWLSFEWSCHCHNVYLAPRVRRLAPSLSLVCSQRLLAAAAEASGGDRCGCLDLLSTVSPQLSRCEISAKLKVCDVSAYVKSYDGACSRSHGSRNGTRGSTSAAAGGPQQVLASSVTMSPA
jgi:hypothetical protein